MDLQVLLVANILILGTTFVIVLGRWIIKDMNDNNNKFKGL